MAKNLYCIGLYKTKKVFSSENPKYLQLKETYWTGAEFIYYPKFEITEVAKDITNNDIVLITITNLNTTAKATLLYSGTSNLLNTSSKSLIENPVNPIAAIIEMTSRDKKLEEFVEQINKYSYVPFCILMQFYMNPNSKLTALYYPYELKLITGLTPTPTENQMGELMYDIYNTLIFGSDLNYFMSFNTFNTQQLGKPSKPPHLASGTYISSSIPTHDFSEITTFQHLKKILLGLGSTSAANPSVLCKFVKDNIDNKLIKGGGLKHNFSIQPAIPRIYRPVQQRKIDYYNYA